MTYLQVFDKVLKDTTDGCLMHAHCLSVSRASKRKPAQATIQLNDDVAGMLLDNFVGRRQFVVMLVVADKEKCDAVAMGKNKGNSARRSRG